MDTPLEDYFTPETACLRADIDDIICRTDDFLVVLDYDNRVTQGLQLTKDVNQQFSIPRMQSDTWFVEDIERADQTTA